MGKQRFGQRQRHLAGSQRLPHVHKTGNVLNKVAKSIQPAVKQDLREIWMAPDRKAAERALAVFGKKYGAKYSGSA
jgi:transposase-like protein